jgi:hypothetical protein
MDKSEEFIYTQHCRSKIHCGVCRDLQGGREWRQGLTELFVLPNDEVDFECPLKKAWTNQPSQYVEVGAGVADSKLHAAVKTAKTAGSGGCGCNRHKK